MEQGAHGLPESQDGFTLIELIIAIAIAGILIAAATPSYTALIESNQLTTIGNTVVASLNIARSEAIKQNKQITMRRISPAGSTWELGWNIFLDEDGDGNEDTPVPSPRYIKSVEALPTNYTLRTGGNYATWIGFLGTGLPVSSGGLGNDTFRVCPPDRDTNRARAVIVNVVGRARSAKGSPCP